MAKFLDGIPLRDGEWRRDGRWWISDLTGERVPVIAGGTNVFAITQAAYRFYLDDGAETANTAFGPQSTAVTANVFAGNADLVLRVLLNETGAGSIAGATTDDYQLQYSKNGGAFTNVTAASSNVVAFASANLTDGGATTQRLTGGGGSFVAGEVTEDGLVDDRQLTANNNTEHVYTVRFVSADLANGDALTFRVLLNGATTNVTYSVTPTVNIFKSAPISIAGVVGALVLAGLSVGVGFQGPTTGALAATGAAPTVEVGGGTETNIAVPAGSAAFTGTILDGLWFLGAESGALTLAGQAPTLATTMPVSAGSLALSGTTSDLARVTALSAGALTLTGTASDVALVLPASVGTIAATGLAPGLFADDPTAIPAGALVVAGTVSALAEVNPLSAGSLSATGTTSALFVGALVSLPAGSLTATGSASDLAYGMACPAGAVTVIGLAPALFTGALLSAPVGAVTLVGQTLALDNAASLTAGSLTLSTLAPDVLNGVNRACGVGALTFAGATSAHAFDLACSTGTLTLSGLAPALLSSYTIAPPSAAISLTGSAPSLSVGMVGSAGTLTVSGLAPTLLSSTRFEMPAGAVVLTGTLPSPLLGAAVMELGSLAFTGYAPLPAVQAQARVFVVMRPDDVAVACVSDDVTVTIPAREYEVMG